MGTRCIALSLVLTTTLMLCGGNAQNDATFFITAPNVFRVGVEETVLVSLLSPENVDVNVKVFLRSQGVQTDFMSKTVTVRSDSPQEVTLRVDPHDLARNEGRYQHIKLGARSMTAMTEKITEVLVTTQSGYVFVQTDKPLYTPNQKVMVRVISLDQRMLPSDRELHVEIMNPQGISVRRFRQTQAVNAFLSDEYQFPSVPVFGNWSVTAFYGPEFSLNSSVKFEVKEYVLPTFSVKVRPPNYILRGAETITTEIDAQYVFGKPVRGRYIFKFGVVEDDGSVNFLDVPRDGYLNDQGHATVTLSNLNAVLGANWFDMYAGLRFHAEAVAIEAATTFRESSTNATAVFAESPYKFSYKRTVRYFKKDLSMQILLDLAFVNGHPAGDVPVLVSADATLVGGGNEALLDGTVASNTDDHGRYKTSINTPANAETIRIQGRTNDPNFGENQATLVFEIRASESPTGDYMIIQPIEAPETLTVGQQQSFRMLRTGDVSERAIHYMFITAGKIVGRGSVSFEVINPIISHVITQDMVPRTRLVAFFLTAGAEQHVIADSLILDVDEQCRGEVSVNFQPNADHHTPSSEIGIHVTAPPGSHVGIMGVDKAVYLLRDKDRLTRRKMFDRMKGYDMGCGPGGGQNAGLIFKDSGLTVLTTANLDVSRRETIGCADGLSRRRRDVDPAEICIDQLSTIRECLREKPNLHRRVQSGAWNCARRATMLGIQCNLADQDVEAYKSCCERAISRRTFVVTSFNRINLSGRGLDDQPDIGNIDVPERFDFKETWFFDQVAIPEDGETALISYNAPSSITEWKITAVSVSPLLGMCVHDDASLKVFQPFFIQLHMPYSIVRLEQALITATIFNYNDNDMIVKVNFTAPEGVCTDGRPGVPIEREIIVRANNASSTSFVVLPVEAGEFPIRVSAGTGRIRDRVRKTLKVVHQGVTRTVPSTVVLNPGQTMINEEESDHTTAAPPEHRIASETRHLNDRQIQEYNISLPQDFIPETEFCSVSFIGNLLGTLGADPINGLEKFLRQPAGCGEQTMIKFAPTLYAYKYMRAVNQDTAELEGRVYGFLADGVSRELTYRKPDGAFAVWTNYPGSTWLTAFVVKVFSEASQFTFVEAAPVNGSIDWIIDSNQQPSGIFRENYRVHHREMIGGVKGDISMTAFVLISLLESRSNLVGEYNKINQAITKATGYLETQVQEGNIVKVYDRAITAYALALASSAHAVDANNQLIATEKVDPNSQSVHFDPDEQNYGTPESKPYWLTRKPSAISVETTGYALLAQMKLGDYQKAGRIAIWLSNQHNYDGGFVSTQDTVIATQALAKYAERPQYDSLDLNCDVHSALSPENVDFGYTINEDNARILEEREVTKAIGGLLTLQARGVGVGKANLVLKYNTEASDIETCPFNVTVNATEVLRPGENKVDHLNISVCARYLKDFSTHMSIIDVGLYSGFTVATTVLDKLKNSSDFISNYELAERSVVFYLNKIPNDEAYCFSFKAEADTVVGNVQPVPVHVYDYYDPDESCTLFYRPGDVSPLIGNLCSENECLCTRSGSCRESRQRDLLADLIHTACERQESYALRATVVTNVMKGGFRVIGVDVTEPIKTGLDNVAPGERREFYLDGSCKLPRFQVGNSYLLVGRRALKFTLENGQEGYKYFIDIDTKVEFWPLNSSRRGTAARIKLNDFRTTLAMTGCPT